MYKIKIKIISLTLKISGHIVGKVLIFMKILYKIQTWTKKKKEIMHLVILNIYTLGENRMQSLRNLYQLKYFIALGK